jgi:hypothetical protein
MGKNEEIKRFFRTIRFYIFWFNIFIIDIIIKTKRGKIRGGETWHFLKEFSQKKKT